MGSISDLTSYASLNMPEEDTGTSGGAIDLDTRVVFTQLDAVSALELVSSNSGDTTQQVTVEARGATGTVASETKTLTGLTAASLSTLGAVARVLQVTMDSDATGTVTLRKASAGATVGTIAPGERGFLCVFREATALSSAAEDWYLKVFLKNTHGSDSLNTATVKLFADPASRVTFAVAASVDDTGSVSNRLTDPGLTFTADDKAVPGGGVLAAGEAIGVWLKFTLPQGDGEHDTTVTLSLEGTFP